MNDVIVCVQDLENYAEKVLPKDVWEYFKSGALSEQTLKFASDLKDVAERDLTITVMGEKLTMPLGIAPTAFQKLAHPEGESATVRASQDKGVIFVLSLFSTTSIEEIARVAPTAIKWFQLCAYKDYQINKQLIECAEKNGFKAIVLTVDSPVFGIRLLELRNHFSLPPHIKLANFENLYKLIPDKDVLGSDMDEYLSTLLNASLTWDDLKWFRSITKLPILLKGILTAEDAIKAADMGIVGVIVSNHGGRQLDGIPATIEALPEIVKAVGDRIDVFVDGGFREGADIFKALALGAKMVFVGRPILWGLSYDGQDGVKKVLDILENELDNTLALAGRKRNLKTLPINTSATESVASGRGLAKYKQIAIKWPSPPSVGFL
ncbi:hypothetical protein FQR65_LT10275 [Abscondita terminalis]|nr:hypothetical protein FQR65_LT10275 [Abscondita terminalis]